MKNGSKYKYVHVHIERGLILIKTHRHTEEHCYPVSEIDTIRLGYLKESDGCSAKNYVC